MRDQICEGCGETFPTLAHWPVEEQLLCDECLMIKEYEQEQERNGQCPTKNM